MHTMHTRCYVNTFMAVNICISLLVRRTQQVITNNVKTYLFSHMAIPDYSHARHGQSRSHTAVDRGLADHAGCDVRSIQNGAAIRFRGVTEFLTSHSARLGGRLISATG